MISAKIIAHSSAPNGKEVVTFELEYPRFIHSELMTHRMFSRNAASSRAIPVAKMIEQVGSNPAMPVHWGKNQPGMQAHEELDEWHKGLTQGEWHAAASQAARLAENMNRWGAHKQIVNRILEPFQWMKTVVTATEFGNFFWLRNHTDAQPEIKRLAEVMLEALNNSVPFNLQPGDWHVPYFEHGVWYKSHLDTLGWYNESGSSLQDALAISSSCCAQVSYRKLDDSLQKALDIYDRLVNSQPVHASPFEHQATPMQPFTSSEKAYIEDRNSPAQPRGWEDGVTHVDRGGRLWSGNFCGFIQHRQLIPGNVVEG